MDKQFTASEVRSAIGALEARDMEYEAEMLQAFADMLEAQEKAVPVYQHRSKSGPTFRWFDCSEETFMAMEHNEHDRKHFDRRILYTHPAPSDAERLAEALRTIQHSMQQAQLYGNDSRREIKLSASVCEQALAAHTAQAQPPAASVTDAMQELADKYHELLWAVARKFPGETRHETALRYIREAECQEAALAAQENPNG